MRLTQLLIVLIYFTFCKPHIRNREDGQLNEACSREKTSLPDTVEKELPTPYRNDYESTSSKLSIILDSLILQFNSQAWQYLAITNNSSGFEYQTERKWYFDSLHRLVYFYYDWSSEGTEGTTHCFFDEGELVAVSEKESYASGDEVKLAYHNFGIKRLLIPGREANDVALNSTFLQDKQSEVLAELESFLQWAINQYDDDDNAFILLIEEENEVTYGQGLTVIETVSCRIPVELFKKF